MSATIRILRHAAFPPIPQEIRDDFTLLRAARLQSQIPLLYLTLFLTIPTAIYGSSEGASPIVRFGIPIFMASVCLLRFVTWMKKRGMVLDVDRAAKMIKGATWVSGSLGALCSTWCVMSWFSAPPEMRIYYPMIMAMGSLATAYCLSTIRLATIINLTIGLLPITVLLLFTGSRMDLAAGTSLAVASAFLLRMIAQQHVQLVDLLMLQRRMRDLADTDPLTGLLNRRALDARLEREIAAAGPDVGFSVALLDLDGFKPVNDCHGHAAGDVLLCTVADRLRAAGADHAIVARLGGDEFAILVPCGAAIAAPAMVSHMLSVLEPPYPIGGHDIHIGASIGVATWPVDGQTTDALFDTADRALYAAKAKSRHPARVDDPGRSAAA